MNAQREQVATLLGFGVGLAVTCLLIVVALVLTYAVEWGIAKPGYEAGWALGAVSICIAGGLGSGLLTAALYLSRSVLCAKCKNTQ